MYAVVSNLRLNFGNIMQWDAAQMRVTRRETLIYRFGVGFNSMTPLKLMR